MQHACLHEAGPARTWQASWSLRRLEITFAFGIGLLMATVDTRRRTLTATSFVALPVIAGRTVLTLTRAGLATMATTIAGAALWRVGGTVWMGPCG